MAVFVTDVSSLASRAGWFFFDQGHPRVFLYGTRVLVAWVVDQRFRLVIADIRFAGWGGKGAHGRAPAR
jgi:hypothetical protein